MSSGFDYRVASSEDRFGLDLAIRDVDVVLNIAGPFSRTAAVIVDTCLRHGVHYLDVTGEIEVMQQLASRHQSALTEGVMIMPGTGFAVVPSDCLAARVSELVPDAHNLCIGINSANFVSRGTAKTMVEMISSDIVIRRNGQLCRVPFGSIERKLDYGEGPRLSTAMSWGDVFTAFYTTGIRNIDVYLEAEPWQNAVYQYTSAFSWLLKTRPWQYLLELQAEALPEVPTSPLPGRVIVAEAVGEAGNRAVARLRTDDGYSFFGGFFAGDSEQSPRRRVFARLPDTGCGLWPGFRAGTGGGRNGITGNACCMSAETHFEAASSIIEALKPASSADFVISVL